MEIAHRLAFRNRRGEWFFLLVLVLTGMLFSLLVGYLIGYLIWGQEIATMSTQLVQFAPMPEVIGFLKTLQMINHAGTFLVPALLFRFLINQPPVWAVQHSQKSTYLWLLLITGINFSISPFINFSQEINELMKLPDLLAPLETWMKGLEMRANTITESFLTKTSPGGLMANLFIMAVLPAVGEELLFRGIVQPRLAALFKNQHLAIVVTSLIFSAMHLQFYGFIPRFLLGLLFGYFFYWTRNLWTAVWAHLINNGTAVVIAYLEDQKLSDIHYQDFGRTDLPLLLITLLVTAALILGVRQLAVSESGNVN